MNVELVSRTDALGSALGWAGLQLSLALAHVLLFLSIGDFLGAAGTLELDSVQFGLFIAVEARQGHG